MKTKNQSKGLFTLSICFGILILIAFIILASKPGQQSNQPDIDEAEFVLIRKFNFGGAVYPGSGNALLFDDPQQIRKIYTYVKSTRNDNHACAWRFVVEFYDEDMESIETYYVNGECSYYNKPRMKPYFEDIENNPTHYIYDVVISAYIDPITAIHDLSAQSYISLPLEHPYINLPKITLEKTFVLETENTNDIREFCDGEISNLLNEFSKEINIVYIDTQFKKNTNTKLHTCNVKASIYLEADFDLTQLEEIALQQDSEIYDIEIPKAYILQVVDHEMDLQRMKTILSNQFTYIENVVPFPQASYYSVEDKIY
jgi:hypothetical protein